jgi:hypothetical protein
VNESDKQRTTAMSRLYLTKEFSELEGLELCVVHWSVTPIGRNPDWRDARTLVMQARDRGGARQGVLGLELEGNGPWTLHHFFEWVRYGVSHTGAAYFEDLGTIPIEYVDEHGDFTHAALVYNIGEFGWTNVAPMELEGAPEEPPPVPQWPERMGHSIEERKLRIHADGLMPPRRFRGEIIAPVGARVIYSIHVSRRNGLNPMADSGQWVYRNEIIV